MYRRRVGTPPCKTCTGRLNREQGAECRTPAFRIAASSLPDEVKARLLASNDQRITAKGMIVIKAQTHRRQDMNRADALWRLQQIVMTGVVDAPRRLVFEAWTNLEHLSHWMLGPKGWTMPLCEIDLRPGGAYRFVWRRSDGTEMGIGGVYQEIAPPERLVSTEALGGDWPETLNTLVLPRRIARRPSRLQL